MRKLRVAFIALTFVVISACELNLPRRGEILCSAPAIITAIRRANANPDPSIIQLPDGCEIVLTNENNSATSRVGSGGNGLPTIRSPITIRGSSEGSTIRRADDPGTPEFRIFYIDGASGGELNLERIALMNGRAENGGSVFIDEGVLRLMDDVVISGNNAAKSGGAIYSWNGILETSSAGQVYILNNQALRNGGGVYAYRNPTVSADVGRNILRLDDFTFQENIAGEYGGAIYTNAEVMELSYTSFYENDAGDYGGAIYIGGRGGSAATIDNSEFVSNSADLGGAIYNARGDSGPETTDRDIWAANTRGNAGLVIWDSWFYGNYAQTYGGAIYNGEEVNISNSLFEENEAGTQGGAIYIWPSGLLDIVNSTFSKNIASAGSALYNIGQAYISYATITESDGSGALYSKSAAMEVANMIVANNGGADCYFRHPVRLIGANLDSDGTCSGFDFTIDPVLGPLQDNGGPTHTYALLAGSPAINAASNFCPDSDQRGEIRPLGDSCDLGAYETGVPVVAAPPGLSVENIEAESIAIDTPEIDPSAIALRNASCRKGADATFDVHNFLYEGQTALLIGRMTEGTWFYLELPDDLGRCWVFAENLTLTGPFDQLPFFTSPELPLPDDGGGDEGGSIDSGDGGGGQPQEDPTATTNACVEPPNGCPDPLYWSQVLCSCTSLE